MSTQEHTENQVKDKIESLIHRIINYMIQKEEEIDQPYRYCTRNSSVSRLSLFDEMSNCNLIGLKTKLPDPDVKILLEMFQMCVDDDYFWFERIKHVVNIYNNRNNRNNQNIQNNTITEQELNDYENLDLWIKVLLTLGDGFKSSYEIPTKNLNNMVINRNGYFRNKFLFVFEQSYLEISELRNRLSYKPNFR